MLRTLFAPAVVAVAIIYSGELYAAGCDDLDWKSEADVAFECIGRMDAELDAAKTALTASEMRVQELSAGLSEARSDLAKLQTALEEIKPEIGALQSQAHSLPEIPKIPAGAVVAFSADACPAGWSRYTKAHGRMIVGATENAEFVAEYRNGSDGQPLPFKKFGEHGGQETVALKESHLPAHDHGTKYALSGQQLDWFVTRGSHPVPTVTRHDDSKYDWKSGGGVAHENMPPYIALYFCKKD